jgi:hypothetical protein
MRRDLAYLEDIVEASDAIAEFIRVWPAISVNAIP